MALFVSPSLSFLTVLRLVTCNYISFGQELSPMSWADPDRSQEKSPCTT